MIRRGDNFRAPSGAQDWSWTGRLEKIFQSVWPLHDVHGIILSPPSEQPPANSSSSQAGGRLLGILLFDDGSCHISRIASLNGRYSSLVRGPLPKALYAMKVEITPSIGLFCPVHWLLVMDRTLLSRKQDFQ
jgi:hypothetical protein